MTAINVIQQTKSVHVLTDGAMIDSNGRLVGFSHKPIAIAHLNAVIIVRGAKR